MPRSAFLRASVLIGAGLFVFAVTRVAGQQGFSSRDRQTDLQMLKDAKDAIQKNYYDPKFHGLNLDATYAEFRQKVESSESNHEAFAYIAAFVDSLSDSHTRFFPPGRVAEVDYGYTLAMVGDKCYVTHLRPGSDAEAKLHVGDQVTAREGYPVNRRDFPEMLYYFNLLSPATVSNFDLVDPSGNASRAAVDSKVQTHAKILDLTGSAGSMAILQLERQEEQIYEDDRDRFAESGDVMIWKMAEFQDDVNDLENALGQARKHRTLILDLRGNPGGAIETLQNMIGFLFDHEVKIADRVRRKETKLLNAKSKGSNAFSGKLIVLVDASSASAAELLARVVQLEKRGTVIGDHTSGQVMEAKYYPYQQGLGDVIPYGFEITDADLVMTDGNSLEHVGVTPDEEMIPTAHDLASGRDPVLAHAAQLAGWNLTPEDAGKLFPYKWLPF